MEKPEPTESPNTTEGTEDEKAHVGHEESPTVMPEEQAEDDPREPSPPPPGSGPGGA